jgi:hypothetical protein
MFNFMTMIAKRLVSVWHRPVCAKLRSFAPYALIEILLPGGSIVALTLWMLRRRKRTLSLAGP